MDVRQLNEVSALTGTVVSSGSFISCLHIDTLHVDTLHVDTLHVDTLHVDTLHHILYICISRDNDVIICFCLC